MRHEMKGSVADNAKLIQAMVDREERSGIPMKGVEDFNFLGGQLWDLNGWFVAEDDDRYIYLNRADGFNVTVQRCEYGKLIYYFVYVEKDRTDSNWGIPGGGLVTGTQSTCHQFRWVRSLKHALKLGEYSGELMLGLANPEDYFLTQEERDNSRKQD